MVKARDEVKLRFVKMLVDFQFHVPDSGEREGLPHQYFRSAMYNMSFL
jgi:hypothetical protein